MMQPERTISRRRNALAGGAALLAGALAPRDAAAQASTTPEYAIFTEFSPASKLMQAGWNTRVFTDTDARKGNGIQCDFTTGVITMAAGVYHITGLSIATYFNDAEPPEMTTIRSPASAGYCRLRRFDPNFVVPSGMRGIENDDPSIICIGSPSSANLTPSTVEAYFETDKTAQMILEHQSGSNPDHIYLRVYTQNSKWHAQARLCFRRL